jgi:hypothetical protein
MGMVNILIVSGALIHVKAWSGFYGRKRLTIVKEGEKTGVEAVCAKCGISDLSYHNRRYKALF